MNLVERASAVLGAWELPLELVRVFTSDPTGAALLALLCNAGAKEAPWMYDHKSALVLHAAEQALAHRRPVWQKPHTGWGEYPVDTLIFVETDIGRLQYHVRKDDPALHGLIGRLGYQDTGWDGVQRQLIARELAVGWLSTQGYAV